LDALLVARLKLEEIGLKHIKTYDELEKFCEGFYQFLLTKNPYIKSKNVKLYRGFLRQANRYMLQLLRNFTCQGCGKNDNGYGLHFHHVQPKTKEAKVSHLVKSGWKQALRETLLCLYLCNECHSKEHSKGHQIYGNNAIINRWRHTYIQKMLGSTE